MYFRTKTVSSWIPDLLALPPWEVKLTFLTHQHGQWPTVTNQWFPVKGHLMWLLKERGGLEHHVFLFPGNPRCRSLLVEESGATTVQSLPPVQMGRGLSAVTVTAGQAGERCELQTSADGARSNSDRELSFPTLYSPDSGTLDVKNNEKKEFP